MAVATKPHPFSLYEIQFRNNRISRTIEIIILFLLLSLISYRLFSLGSHDHIPWLLALICEAWFTFVWILSINCKWNQIQTKTYPQRLLQWLGDGTSEFPAVDMFVTTADPELEPPIITVNTVLSLLAVDYPANKLACYVSDDGASPLTFYSLVEASNFAKLWVPFCKKYNVAVRSPFRYFNANPTFPQDSSLDFKHEWRKMKDEYSKLCAKIEEATATQESLQHDFTGEFSVFANIERRDHSTIIKVIWENKESFGNDDGVPHLIYISREKRPKHPHHYKAGAMNVLTRVSGVMTNAPFMLNVDCDCYANDPKVVLQAMCFLLGVEDEKDAGFAQFPQSFIGGLKDDPFGNQLKVLMEYLGRGVAGIQGPFYQGTGCFHRRKVIYGMSPNVADASGKSVEKDQWLTYGKSKVFNLSIAQILSGSLYPEIPIFSNSFDAAKEVASCGYESGTAWGQKVGWMYGSTTEDILTGLTIHSKGWKTAYCVPDPPGFLGSAPTGGPAALTQQKRWATGLMEILISKKSPILSTLFRRLQFRQCLAYLWVIVWPIRPIFEICYALLPAYCIINNSHFQPKLNEAAITIPASIFIIYNLYNLFEYVKTGESPRAWWNNQRMLKVNASAPWLFGLLSVIVKVVGLSETVFEITKKDHSSDDGLDKEDSDVGRFTFDESPLFVPGTTILLVNMAALFIGFLDFKQKKKKSRSWSLGEAICSVWVILMYWAFLKGLFGKGKYGIPLSTVLKSGGLALLFVHASKFKY